MMLQITKNVIQELQISECARSKHCGKKTESKDIEKTANEDDGISTETRSAEWQVQSFG